MKEFPGGTFGLPCALDPALPRRGRGARQAEAQRDPARARRRLVTTSICSTLTEELCAIPSVSGDEAALADLVEARLREHARRARRSSGSATNVVARTELGADRRVVLGGHLDTVPPNGNASPARDGDTLHGLGTADMKGGLAVLLAARGARLASGDRAARRDARVLRGRRGRRRAQRLAPPVRRAPRPRRRATSRSCSSRPAGGSRPAARARSTCARPSTATRAHSARPWMGINAIHRAAPLLARVRRRSRPPTVDVDGLDYREALQVVRIEGGIANNVVPDRCAVVVNRRYAPVALARRRGRRGDALCRGRRRRRGRSTRRRPRRPTSRTRSSPS